MSASPPASSALRGRLVLYLAYAGYGGLLLSVILTALMLPYEAGSVPAYITRQDFVGIYLGTHMVASGQTPQLYDLTAQYQLQVQLMSPYAPLVHTLYFTYPGWVAMLLSPLGRMSFPQAFWIWAVVNLIAFVATVVLLMKLVHASALPVHRRNILLLVAAGFTPFWFALWQGQTPILVCLALVALLLALRERRDYGAGAWLALGLIKPQLIAVPVLALALNRRWRTLAALVVGGCLLLVASLIALGNWIPGYLQLLSTYVGTGASVGDDPAIMHNWRGLAYRLLGSDTGTGGLLVTTLTLLTVAAVVVVCRPDRVRKGRGLELCLAVAIIAGLLVDAHLYLHDAVIAIVAGFILWTASDGPDIRLRLLRGLLLAGPFVARLALSIAPPVVEIGSWYLALLLLATLWAWPLMMQDKAAPEHSYVLKEQAEVSQSEAAAGSANRLV